MTELAAYYQPYNAVNACWSKSECTGYDIPVDGEDRNMLTQENWNTDNR